MGQYGTWSKDTSEIIHQIHSPMVSTKVVERIVKFLMFAFFPFSLTLNHMGVKNSNNISSESTHGIHSTTPYILVGRVSAKVVKFIVKNERLNLCHFFCSFYFAVQHGNQ